MPALSPVCIDNAAAMFSHSHSPSRAVCLLPPHQTMESGNIAAWLVKEGDAVAPGDAIADVHSSSSSMGDRVPVTNMCAAEVFVILSGRLRLTSQPSPLMSKTMATWQRL